jgi:hypothetical protein
MSFAERATNLPRFMVSQKTHGCDQRRATERIPMAKKNPQVEQLERMNKMLREQIERMRREPPETPLVACDNSCVVATPDGMATNGGCRCDERKLRRAVQFWRGRAQYLQAVVQLARDGERERIQEEILERCAPTFEKLST